MTKLMKTAEAAEYIGMSRASFYRIARKHLNCIRYGENNIRYEADELDRFKDERREMAEARNVQ